MFICAWHVQISLCLSLTSLDLLDMLQFSSLVWNSDTSMVTHLDLLPLSMQLNLNIFMLYSEHKVHTLSVVSHLTDLLPQRKCCGPLFDCQDSLTSQWACNLLLCWLEFLACCLYVRGLPSVCMWNTNLKYKYSGNSWLSSLYYSQHPTSCC